MEIDFGMALDFVDIDGRAYQLRFRRNDYSSDYGQLIAVVDDRRRPDHGHTIPISRPDVLFQDVDSAINGWQSWAQTSEHTADLDLIRRITDANPA
ncbi:hypothetical protein GBP94_24625 [Mycobacterium avium subsp. hominissuis]|uniref:hypothetical protein n=1 Tax=Mycobacterium avium TaxID=1764 RepID=UPI000A073B1F|nr:hypothetical protein [Mycobacterium avium]MBZ4632551.1 hypothetical protein [Mycobacterium avium subsp. hominissuis]